MRLIDIVFGNLRRRKGRMALIIIGLAIGVGTVVALRSLTSAVEQEVGAQLDRYGANIVIVPKASSQEISYGGITLSSAAFDVHQLRKDDLQAIRSIKYAGRLSILAPKLLGTITENGRNVFLAGVDFKEELKMKQWWQISGSIPGTSEEVLLGYDAAKKLGLIVSPTIGSDSAHNAQHQVVKQNLRLKQRYLTLSGRTFRITGIIHETGGSDDRFIYSTLSTAQELLGKPDEFSLIEVSALCNGCPIDDIVAQLNQALPHAKVSALMQAVRARAQTVERLSRFSTAVSIVMLLVGALMVFITMMASVVERTREIGVLRALGFRKAHIIRIFILEASIISVIGGASGWAAGTFISIVSASRFTDGVGIRPSAELALAAIVAAVLMGVLSSLHPAIKASKLDPIESLRYF